jgi:hypothetical protein
VTSLIEVANCLALAPSSLSRIMFNKNKIIEGEIKCGAHSKKRMNPKLGTNEGLENMLLQRFQQMCSVNLPTYRSIICQKATDIALRLKIDNFIKAPNVWLHRHLK